MKLKRVIPWKKSYDQPIKHVKHSFNKCNIELYGTLSIVLRTQYKKQSPREIIVYYERIDAFELWCWRRLLRVPWTARRSNQSITEISPGCSLEGMILKLKFQYFGHLMRRVDSLEKPWCWERLGAGEGDNRRWDGCMASPTWWMWTEWTPRVGDGQGGLACCNLWGHKESETTEGLKWTDSPSFDQWAAAYQIL